MINCYKCGARCVMDPNAFDDAIGNCGGTYYIHAKHSHKSQVEIPLLFIERGSDYIMNSCRSKRRLTDAEVTELVNAYSGDNLTYDPVVLARLEVVERDDDDDDDAFDEFSRQEERVHLMNISLPINSYNAEAPETEVALCLETGGRYAVLQLRMPDGTPYIMSYSE